MDFNQPILGAPNFRYGEFFVTSHDQAKLRQEFLALPALEQALFRKNIEALACRLQTIRDFYRKSIKITSGWRSPRVNKAVGGASESLHLLAMAADIMVDGVPPGKVQYDFRGWTGGLGTNSEFTHLDLRSPAVRFTY